MLYRRIATTFAFVAIFFLFVFVLPHGLFSLVVSLFVAGALYELYRMMDKGRIERDRWVGIVIGASFPLLRWVDCARDMPLKTDLTALGMLALLGVSMGVAACGKTYEGCETRIATTCWGALYVGWLFSFVVPLKALPAGNVALTMLFVVVKVNDMGAYLVGTQFGRHKFFPRLSPKKTWEGALGGLAGSLLGAMLVLPFLQGTLVDMTWKHAVGLGLVFAVLSPLGDLFESLVKRALGYKDSGGVLFGTGGILDGMDSLLFAVPIFYGYMRWRWGG